MLPDMIEIGSFMGLAAMTQSEITIKNCQVPMLGVIPDVFRRLGIDLEIRGDDIYIPAQEHYRIDSYLDGSTLNVADAPGPASRPTCSASCWLRPFRRRERYSSTRRCSRAACFCG